MQENQSKQILVESLIPASPREAKDHDIQILELDNPNYIARNESLHEMIRDLLRQFGSPSITFESLLNFLSTMVYGIYTAKQHGVPNDSIKTKFFLGFVDGKLDGFLLYFMMADRAPHIQTIDVPYVYSNNMKISYEFAKQLVRSKRKWGARHIAFVLANPKFAKIAKRFFSNAKKIGEYWIVEDLNYKLIA